jgi:hypothetical protein
VAKQFKLEPLLAIAVTGLSFIAKWLPVGLRQYGTIDSWRLEDLKSEPSFNREVSQSVVVVPWLLLFEELVEKITRKNVTQR